MCVKGNQKKLHEAVIQVTEQCVPIDDYQQREQSHGRQENRRILVYDDLEDCPQQWTDLTRLICVQRWGNRAGERYSHVHYYISDLDLSAERFASLVRGHWSIENKLHWPKDMVLNEDKAKQRYGHTPANWSMVRNIFVNLAKKLGFDSIAQAKRFLANQPQTVLLSLQ